MNANRLARRRPPGPSSELVTFIRSIPHQPLHLGYGAMQHSETGVVMLFEFKMCGSYPGVHERILEKN